MKQIPGGQMAVYRRENLGFVFQDFNLLDTFSIKDNIFLPLVLARKNIEEMKQRLSPLAELLGIRDILEKFPYEVSGGQKQRAAVARALITEPKLLLPGRWIPGRRTGCLVSLRRSTGRGRPS